MVSTVDIERAGDGFINVRSVLSDAPRYDDYGRYIADMSMFTKMNNRSPDWRRAQKIYIEFDQKTNYRNNLNLLNSIVRTGYNGDFLDRIEFQKSQISDNLYVADVSHFSDYHADQGVGVEGGLPFNARIKIWIDYDEMYAYKGHRNFLKIPYKNDFVIEMTIHPNANGWLRCVDQTFSIMQCAGRNILLRSSNYGPGGSRYLALGFPDHYSNGGPVFILGDEFALMFSIKIPCSFKRDPATDKIIGLEIGDIEWWFHSQWHGQTSPVYHLPGPYTITDPYNKYHISVLDHFYGEVESLAILEGNEYQDLIKYVEVPLKGVAPSGVDDTDWWNKLGYTLEHGNAESDQLLTKIGATGVTVPDYLYSVPSTSEHHPNWAELNEFIMTHIPQYDSDSEYRKGSLVRDFYNYRIGSASSFLTWCFFECRGTGRWSVSDYFQGDNLVGNVVSMIRDYETNELHALVSPDRAGLRKDGKILEYLLTNEKVIPIASTLMADRLDNLKYGQVGYNENGKFELLSVHKGNWEYDFRNILQRKDRPKRLAIPSKMRYVNGKPIYGCNKVWLSYCNFIEVASGRWEDGPIEPPPITIEEDSNALLLIS